MHDDADGSKVAGSTPRHDSETAFDDVPIELVKILRSIAPQAVQRITLQVQLEVAAYAGPSGGNRHRLVLVTVDKAVSYFIDALERKPVSVAPIHSLVRQLARAEASDGHSVDALRAAHHVASTAAWEEIRRVSRNIDMDPASVTPLADALCAYITQLIDQVNIGHTAATLRPDSSSHVARRHLLTAMLSGHPPERYAHHLTAANWEAPNEISVVTGILDFGVKHATLPTSTRTMLSGINRSRLTLVAGPEHAAALSQQLSENPGVESVATSWAVQLAEVRDAYRWTYRALDLAARGIINEQGVINCVNHRAILWLHADPTLAQHASEELLEPLLGMKPYYRALLAETMLIWLQVRESAPVLADRMHIHEQTVRRRLRQLKELFGDQLSDPQQTLAFLGALEVALPRWRDEVRSRPLRRIQT